MATPQLPRADSSVRIATADDAAPIAGIQADAWRLSYSGLLPAEAVEAFDIDAATNGWTLAIAEPPSRLHRVFVAVDPTSVVGFAASAPATDTDLNPERDAELLALHVAPGAVRL